VRIAVPVPAVLRAICIAAFFLVLYQLFFLPEPPLVRELKNLFWDKICHAAAFGTFAALLWFAIGWDIPFVNWLLIVAVGAVDEFHQIFIPTRSADIFDLVADAVGAALATYLLHRLSRNPRSSPCVESSVPSRAAMSSPSSSRA
jgi:VanZ family protein